MVCNFYESCRVWEGKSKDGADGITLKRDKLTEWTVKAAKNLGKGAVC